MIPKVINYCWFGGNPLSQEAKKCIETWKKYCPDYKIIEWNESNYDINKNKYMSDAYKEKKWAFVSDYARVDIIYKNGGIYLDTDVEIIKSFDDLLNNKMFCGWESREKDTKLENSISFGLGYGSEKENPILKDILELYNNINFINSDGSLNLTACPKYQTDILKKYGLDTSQRTLQKKEWFVAYPEDYFSPKSQVTGEIAITKNTYSIHHFTETWGDRGDRFFRKMENKISKKTNKKIARKIVRYLSIPYRIYRKINRIIKKEKRKNKIKHEIKIENQMENTFNGMGDLISVVIPVYNNEKFLRKCIDSIINQTYRNIEVILVNDGSIDNSLQICMEYSDKYKNIKVFNQKNLGPSSARNNGITHAKGKYTVLIDSDDYVDLNMIEQLLKNNQKSTLVGIGRKSIENGKIFEHKYKKQEFGNEEYMNEILCGNIMGTSLRFFIYDKYFKR